MAEVEKEEYQFPDEAPQKSTEEKIEIHDEANNELQIDIEDDTPVEDRNRTPSDPNKVKELEVEVDDLQRIEAGVLKELTLELKDAIAKRFANNKLLTKQHKLIQSECTICHTSIDLIHHINIYNNIRTCNGDSGSFIKTLSMGNTYIISNDTGT